MTTINDLQTAHATAMEMAGLDNPERVSIHFDVFRGEDGGPLFTIIVLIPSKDRRRIDEKERGSGETLEVAIADLRRRLDNVGLLAE